MKVFKVNWLMAVLVVGLASISAPVFGQVIGGSGGEGGADQQTSPDDGCGYIDWSNPCYASTTHFTSCVSTEGCYTCGNEVSSGLAVCVSNVHHSASCGCEISYPPPSYAQTCRAYGQCTYRS